MAKFFAALLNQRLTDHLESQDQLQNEQAGFRRGRTCLDQIFSLREVLSARARRPTYACFVDIRKAYDTVWRDGLWTVFWQKGVRGRMWRVLQAYYAQVQSCVWVVADSTE